MSHHDQIMLLAGSIMTLALLVVGRSLANRWRRWRAQKEADFHERFSTQRRIDCLEKDIDWLEKESARMCKALNNLAGQYDQTKKDVARLSPLLQPVPRGERVIPSEAVVDESTR